MMTQPSPWAKRPNVLPWPPMIYAAAALAGFALGRWFPLHNGGVPGGIVRAGGALMMLLGLGLDGSAMLTMWRARANILPNRAATALVSSGPFAVSRNPIYLGNTLLVAGAAFVWGNFWYVPAALVAAALVQRLAIQREEQHMAERFGEAWRLYAQRTPRWIRLWRR
jgi:protein-S-isoprenylcysteine O-methyltransferase Ste14